MHSQHLRLFQNMGHEIGGQLSLQGILIKFATTDSVSAQGLDNVLKIIQPMWSVQRSTDPTHMGQSQF